ncbi:DUF5691 domain-containing protein [Nocardia cyriacigeorgica]|uniref:DUF5691 domain-containing protein n=1 Tax=Nocardia cyriacigeorgica TaxID=135487 RepID=UPI0028114CE6|nr:DUF5691 domain-containing protein [Nocardia cyriacigeorgica]
MREAEPVMARQSAAAEQRRVRVSAGLAELDIWLADQVRTGLAQSDRSFGAFETMAARMVDAQAPGVAAILRQVPVAVITRPDWPQVVLDRYARLHLLVTAHRRLDELAPPLAASVRTHIGYPTKTDAVRVEPAVRDHWMTLGIRVTEDERLYTRRTWLYGRRSGRWALLIDHSFGSPGFAVEAPALGMMADADVHFYPAAAPLRALWGSAHGGAEPFTTVPHDSDTGIVPAMDRYADALGADPWLGAWPMLLTDVVPVADEQGGYLAQSDGTALPLATVEPVWRLLGVSGGHPVTVTAEWTDSGLLPLSVLSSGDVIDVGAVAGVGGGRAALVSEDLASAALLGTARRSPRTGTLPAPVAAATNRLDTDPALLLLESAALDATFARAGALPDMTTVPDPADDDPRAMLPRAAAQRLTQLLHDRSHFLPEWLCAAAPLGYRAPDTLSAQLLDYAAGHADVREPLLRLAGARGRWLAARNPAWRTLIRHRTSAAEPTASDDAWRFGHPPERIDWLAALRRHDPAAARAALVAVWPSESGPLKAELLAVLHSGISPDDEPLLESALDDRRGDVRRTAAGLLRLLPDSAFARRMTDRARAWVRVSRRALHVQLSVDIPDALADDAIRDGITDRTGEFGYRWAGGPDIAAARLRHLVAATPLAHWEAALGSPQRATTATIEDRFRQPMFDGWVDAALAERDPTWARALFDAGVPSDLAMLRRRELFGLLPLTDRSRHVLRLDGAWLSEIEALLPAIGHPWPQPVARHVLLLLHERARAAERRPGAHGTTPAAHRSLLTAASVHLPAAAARTALTVARRCADPAWAAAFDRLADDTTTRSTMLEELQ